ncbi:MAG: NDP-hexose 2,3-dehydratase family protein [Candidatus Gracilibacteria bacterium]|nr:NDP-hexose 2,3-dehydratase family protein [Candidatus Gracilibacteria bacterium]
MKNPLWLTKWFDELICKSQFEVEEIPFSESQSWSFEEGALRHKSGRFFQIVGAGSQPFIEQREIGTLGFLMRVGKFKELLLQAKIEPGNIGIVQLSPSCQATASNLSMVHGGSLPLGAEYFKDDAGLISQSLQSEQGTRFLGKRNLNVLKMIQGDIEECDAHRWLAVDEVLELLKMDYLINTDARSVLVSSPWRDLIDREPFTRCGDRLSKELAASFAKPLRSDKLSSLRAELALLRSQKHEGLVPVSLDKLQGWNLTKKELIPVSGSPFRVKQIRVQAYGREVPSWDQPIIDSSGQGLVDLEIVRVKGVLYCVFRLQIEDGLDNQIQLGPSFLVEPGDKLLLNENAEKGKNLIEAYQSDEGGRFWQDSSLYRIIDLGEQQDFPINTYCLTLAEVQDLLLEGEQFTNEARSVLALLLTWL